MEAEKKFTKEEAHRWFAVECFNQIWPLLEKEGRTEADKQLMIRLAYTSLHHWLQVGKPVNEQRGEWMLSRVYTVLEYKENALIHAKRCIALTEKNGFNDFDLAYAYEAMARAFALNGNASEFRKYYDLASQANDGIKAEEDRKIFMSDLHGPPWFGFC